MNNTKRIVTPDKNGALRGEFGEVLIPPKEWSFLPAGDAGLTRKVTAKGVFWRVQIKKGRRFISKGIWAPSQTILEAQDAVQKIRSTDVYKKKREYDLKRRTKNQEEYAVEFCKAVETFLNFHVKYKMLEKKFAQAVTEHAIPVGSGTVARTKMIPLEERASRAVIAWMRHKTTAYDNIKIARVKGERRAVRRMYAQQSNNLLTKYRRGEELSDNCPLKKAL